MFSTYDPHNYHNLEFISLTDFDEVIFSIINHKGKFTIIYITNRISQYIVLDLQNYLLLLIFCSDTEMDQTSVLIYMKVGTVLYIYVSQKCAWYVYFHFHMSVYD